MKFVLESVLKLNKGLLYNTFMDLFNKTSYYLTAECRIRYKLYFFFTARLCEQIPSVELRKACVHLLLSMLCLPLHFKDLEIKGEFYMLYTVYPFLSTILCLLPLKIWLVATVNLDCLLASVYFF